MQSAPEILEKSNILLANLENLFWDNNTREVPIATPGRELYTKYNFVIPDWISNEVGNVRLTGEYNHCIYQGNYYFLKKNQIFDIEKKDILYTLIKDYWCCYLSDERIFIKGCLNKTNDKQLIIDNINLTKAVIDTPNHVDFLGIDHKDSCAVDTALMDKVLLITEPTTDINVRKLNLVSTNGYNHFLKQIEDFFTLQTSIQKNHLPRIIACLPLEEHEHWQSKVFNIVAEFLVSKKGKLQVRKAPGFDQKRTTGLQKKFLDGYLEVDDEKGDSKTLYCICSDEEAIVATGGQENARYVEKIDLSGCTDVVWLDNDGNPRRPESSYIVLVKGGNIHYTFHPGSSGWIYRSRILTSNMVTDFKRSRYSIVSVFSFQKDSCSKDFVHKYNPDDLKGFAYGSIFDEESMNSQGIPYSTGWSSIKYISGVREIPKVLYDKLSFLSYTVYASDLKTSEWNKLLLWSVLDVNIEPGDFFFNEQTHGFRKNDKCWTEDFSRIVGASDDWELLYKDVIKEEDNAWTTIPSTFKGVVVTTESSHYNSASNFLYSESMKGFGYTLRIWERLKYTAELSQDSDNIMISATPKDMSLVMLKKKVFDDISEKKEIIDKSNQSVLFYYTNTLGWNIFSVFSSVHVYVYGNWSKNWWYGFTPENESYCAAYGFSSKKDYFSNSHSQAFHDNFFYDNARLDGGDKFMKFFMPDGSHYDKAYHKIDVNYKGGDNVPWFWKNYGGIKTESWTDTASVFWFIFNKDYFPIDWWYPKGTGAFLGNEEVGSSVDRIKTFDGKEYASGYAFRYSQLNDNAKNIFVGIKEKWHDNAWWKSITGFDNSGFVFHEDIFPQLSVDDGRKKVYLAGEIVFSRHNVDYGRNYWNGFIVKYDVQHINQCVNASDIKRRYGFKEGDKYIYLYMRAACGYYELTPMTGGATKPYSITSKWTGLWPSNPKYPNKERGGKDVRYSQQIWNQLIVNSEALPKNVMYFNKRIIQEKAVSFPSLEVLYHGLNFCKFEHHQTEFLKYKDYIPTIDNTASTYLHGMGSTTVDSYGQRIETPGLADIMLRELYRTYAAEISGYNPKTNMFSLLWFDIDQLEREEHYFDLVGTDYCAVIKKLQGRYIVELIIKTRQNVKFKVCTKIEFANKEDNSSNIPKLINQQNTLYVKGTNFDLKSKFIFKGSNIWFDDWYINEIDPFGALNVATKKDCPFAYYRVRLQHGYDHIETLVKKLKTKVKTTEADWISWEQLRINHEEAKNNRHLADLNFRENRRHTLANLDIEREKYNYASGPGYYLDMINMAVSGISGVYTGRAGAEAGAAMYQRSEGKWDNMGPRLAPDMLRHYTSPANPVGMAYGMSQVVGGIAGMAGSLSNMVTNMSHRHHSQKMTGLSLQEQQKASAANLYINSMKLHNTHHAEEMRHRMEVSSFNARFMHGEINEPDVEQAYLKDFKGFSMEFHIKHYTPVKKQLEFVTAFYNRYGADIFLEGYTFKLNEQIKRNSDVPKLIVRFEAIDYLNISDIIMREAIKARFLNGVMIRPLENVSLEDFPTQHIEN